MRALTKAAESARPVDRSPTGAAAPCCGQNPHAEHDDTGLAPLYLRLPAGGNFESMPTPDELKLIDPSELFTRPGPQDPSHPRRMPRLGRAEGAAATKG